MSKIFVITYVNDPKNFDIVRLVSDGTIVETDVLATSEKEEKSFHAMPEKRFFTPLVWKRAVPVTSLKDYATAAQQTEAFKAMLTPAAKIADVPVPQRKINF